MNGFGKLLRQYWWQILVGVFALGGAWSTVQGQLNSHAARLDKAEANIEKAHDFITRQDEINKIIPEINRKIDRLLSRGK